MGVLEIESTQRQSCRGQEAGYNIAKRLVMLSLRVDSFVITRFRSDLLDRSFLDGPAILVR